MRAIFGVIIIVNLFFSSSCSAQIELNRIGPLDTVTCEGYAVTVAGNWIFVMGKRAFNNNKSFLLENITADFGPDLFAATQALGKKKCLKYYDGYNNEVYEDTVWFLRCRIKIVVYSKPKYLDRCKFELYHEDQKDGVGCIFFNNAVLDIKPLRRKDQKKYLQYFKTMCWGLPDWSE